MKTLNKAKSQNTKIVTLDKKFNKHQRGFS